MLFRRRAFRSAGVLIAVLALMGLQRTKADTAAVIAERAAHHWSFSKPISPALPQKLVHGGWVRNPIDAWVLANLEPKGLSPSPEADRYTLIRRASLDLTGLPPTVAVIDAFANDPSPTAYEKMLDGLLTNPHFGERWARVWLDLARYADSRGYGSDPLRMTIHRYRDWVIQAFNRNLPYDQFVTEQIAGDLLPNATTDQLIATAFNRNTMTNTEGGTDAEEFRVAAVKDRVDTTMQVFMGLTMGCAQCHNHKYDPISNKEYYQLYAIFNQTEDNNNADESPTVATPSVEQQQSIQKLQSQIAEIEQGLKDPARVATGQILWEKRVAKELASSGARWKTLAFSGLKSASGGALTTQADGSILVSGASADRDSYTLLAPAPFEHMTAFRIEAIPDANLPHGGPGRGADGRATVTDFHVTSAASQGTHLRGRFVRVENDGPGRYLHLAEVQVYDGATNLALAGTASQSSVDYGGDARRAIDGNTDGEFFRSNSVTHTKSETDPWWEVDLGAVHDIDRVVIWNRTDGGTYARLTDGKLTVFDDAHKVIWQTPVAPPPNPSAEFGPGNPQTVSLVGPSDSAPAGHSTAASAIDGDPDRSGWAVSSNAGESTAAVFQTASENVGAAGTNLTFTIVQHDPGHALGRFRISATSAPRPVVELPSDVTHAIATSPERRTADQRQVLLSYYQSIAPELQTSREQVAKLKTEIDTIKPYMTAVMRELPAGRRRECRMLVKGNFMTKGEVVPPAVPSAFGPAPADQLVNRLTLAHYIASTENPLTARVAVNRFWAQLFGIGIVETQEDFGSQGTPPVNQPLLDWLVVDFMQNGWDIKRLLKTIMMSATYRQSSRATPELLAVDPHNRLNARGPRQRLEAELVRDQALSLSGLLSAKMFGPSVFPPQPPNLWQAAFNGERTYPTSMGEDLYRRGLYVFWRRTTPYPSMSAFDAPSREVCTIRRIPTSTPLQAFVTLNDPVYVECAQALARRILREGGSEIDARIAFGLKLCLARPAMQSQVDALKSLYQQELSRYQSDPSSAMKVATVPIGPLPAGASAPDLAAWTVTSNVLLNLDGVLTKN